MKQRDRLYSKLAQIALSEFADIVIDTLIFEGKLRIFLKDDSFIDIWLSIKKRGVYAYHWERRSVDGTIYRYDNLPDPRAKKLKTYPKHFHFKIEENIIESEINDIPEEAIKTVLEFVRKIIGHA